MNLSPTPLDFWIATATAELLREYRLLGQMLQSGIRHNVLGGFWFALAFYAYWVQSAREGQQSARVRLLTVAFGSVLSILLTFAAGALISWPPPARHPQLAGLFPKYLDANPNTNCFPSQSTALYGAMAAGIYSLHKLPGALLWLAVGFLVAFPRVIVGGHYLSDVVGGLLLAFLGYAVARYVLESRFISKLDRFLDGGGTLRTAREILIFVWILQVAVEFRDAVWFKRGMETLLK